MKITKKELITFLQDASGAIYMAENWAHKMSELNQLAKARKQLKDVIQYLNDGGEITD